MSDDLITVASYYNPTNAHLARIALARSGIECVVLDENYAHISPHHRLGVRVQVRESEARRVHTILWGQSATRKLRCSTCGSERIEVERPWWLPWIFALSIMTMIPFGRSVIKVRCQDCGHVGRAVNPPKEKAER